MKITATNKATGEVVELEAGNLEQIQKAWRVAQEYEKTAKALKDQLKFEVLDHIGSRGVSDEVNGFVFRQSVVQRRTYNRAVLREQLDPDTFDVLMKPDKKAVDNYLKENMEELKEKATIIRQNMIDDGMPSERIVLQKVVRDA